MAYNGVGVVIVSAESARLRSSGRQTGSTAYSHSQPQHTACLGTGGGVGGRDGGREGRGEVGRGEMVWEMGWEGGGGRENEQGNK